MQPCSNTRAEQPAPRAGATSLLLLKLPPSVSHLAGPWTALPGSPVQIYLITLFLTLGTEIQMLSAKATNAKTHANSEKVILPGTSFQRACP